MRFAFVVHGNAIARPFPAVGARSRKIADEDAWDGVNVCFDDDRVGGCKRNCVHAISKPARGGGSDTIRVVDIVRRAREVRDEYGQFWKRGWTGRNQFGKKYQTKKINNHPVNTV